MAPQKAVVVSQQPNTDQAAVKPRKRKGKQQQYQTIQTPQTKTPTDIKQIEVSTPVGPDPKNVKSTDNQQPSIIQPIDKIKNKSNLQRDAVTQREPIAKTRKPTAPTNNLILNKQLVNDEVDDLDAGIELDGSSNSGSSVKDINETDPHVKSASASPVMAQSSIVNDQNTKQAVEVESVEQTTGLICSKVTKKVSTTKQQLAANLQDIDEDELLLREKIKSKQLKLVADEKKQSTPASAKQIVANSDVSISSKGDKFRRKFSQTSQDSQDGPFCKVCDQHVYQMERVLAEKSVYHRQCFRCNQCKVLLRVDNYSSHEGMVYCKAHHRQIFQPRVNLDNENDVDIVAKSTTKPVDDYLLHRGRLSELSFSFLQPKTPQESRKRQMIICENEPAELPEDVVRSNTKVDDGIGQLNLNLNNILEKFERGNTTDESTPSSAGVLIEKPSFNIKKTLLAFETNTASAIGQEENSQSEKVSDRPVVKKLTNINGFLKKQNSEDQSSRSDCKPIPVKRSESLMMRLKKYESRIAGAQVDDDDDAGDQEVDKPKSSQQNQTERPLRKIKLSTLKSQWENGNINPRADSDDDEAINKAGDNTNGNSPLVEKNEELSRIKLQLARKKSGPGGVRNIYENAIKEARQAQSRRDSNDLSALNGFSTINVQKQLLRQTNGDSTNNQNGPSTPSSPNKDHFQLNLSRKANKLKERFELGLIDNNSHDSDLSDNDGGAVNGISKLEQLRQEKLDDLSIFTDGEIKAREARSMFQQIDRRISASNIESISAYRTQPRSSITSQTSKPDMNDELDYNSRTSMTENQRPKMRQQQQQPIRLTNNVGT